MSLYKSKKEANCDGCSDLTEIRLKAGFQMSHFIVIHRISWEFWVHNQLGLFPIYENRQKQGILIHPDSPQFIENRRN